MIITAEEPQAQARRLALCTMPVTEASVPAQRRFARQTARWWHVPAAAEEALSLVATELVTNVLLHSGSPYVVLLLRLEGATLTVEVRDGGRWRRRRGPRTVAEDAHAACGRGLPLVEAYAVACTVIAGDRGTRVVAELSIDAPA